LYVDLSGAVAGYLRLQGAREPEDLTSEVFLGVFTGLRRFNGDEPAFRSWVFTIAHRRLVDERRRIGRQPAVGGQLADVVDRAGGNAETDALAALGERWVRDVCADIAPDQRSVLLLRIVGDLTVEEVAEVLGRSAGAVKQLQRRGLIALRKILDREGVPL